MSERTRTQRVLVGLLIVVVLAAVACRVGASEPSSSELNMMLDLTVTIDGVTEEKPEYLEATVRRDDNTVHLCTATEPVLKGGRVQVTVLSSGQLDGCGKDDSDVWLSLVHNGKILFSTTKISWAASQSIRQKEVSFSHSEPSGMASRFTQLSLDFFPRLDRQERVVARIGDTICGYAPAIDNDAEWRYVFLDVAGPELIPGCDEGASIDIETAAGTHYGASTNDFVISGSRPVVTIGGPNGN